MLPTIIVGVVVMVFIASQMHAVSAHKSAAVRHASDVVGFMQKLPF
jgi:hypothetical protein